MRPELEEFQRYDLKLQRYDLLFALYANDFQGKKANRNVDSR